MSIENSKKRKPSTAFVFTPNRTWALVTKFAKRKKKDVLFGIEELVEFRKKPCSQCNGSLDQTGLPFEMINPKGKISLLNLSPICGVCKNLKLKDKFDPIDYAKKQLRRNWKKTPMAILAIQKAKVGPNQYKCAECFNIFNKKQIHLDHKEPLVPTNIESKNQQLDEYAKRLYCDECNLQVICKPDHYVKNAIENAERKMFRMTPEEASQHLIKVQKKLNKKKKLT